MSFIVHLLVGFVVGAVVVLIWQPWRRQLHPLAGAGVILVVAGLVGLLAGIGEAQR